MRQLSKNFLNLLYSNEFKGLLSYVKSDNTLDLEIRENCINIYYRGGSALQINQTNENKYDFHFDRNYFKGTPFEPELSLPILLSEIDWKDYFPVIKQAMDFWFTKNPKEEREFQQLVVRENNYSCISNSTDYFILDIEYDNRKNARFDIVAMEWQSDASARKLQNNHKPKLVILEMKYGDGALKGIAGLQKHVSDFERFLSCSEEVDKFKEEMLTVLHQKRYLGLIPCLSKNSNEVTEFNNDLEFMFLLANHDPASSILRKECEILSSNMKFITSNFSGYGLYKENVFDCTQFKQRFKLQL